MESKNDKEVETSFVYFMQMYMFVPYRGMCRSQNIITSISTTEGNFLLNDYHFRGTGQYYVTVCIIQSFQKLFISPFVKSTSLYQDSHMQIIGGNPDHYQASA